MTEYDETVQLANRILERPYADPDDDWAMLSRQFLRQVEAVTAWQNVTCALFDRNHCVGNADGPETDLLQVDIFCTKGEFRRLWQMMYPDGK